jgi:serine/threonine protein kinase
MAEKNHAVPAPADVPSAGYTSDPKWKLIGSGTYGKVWRHGDATHVWKSHERKNGAASSLAFHQVSLWKNRISNPPPSLCGIHPFLFEFLDVSELVWLTMPFVGVALKQDTVRMPDLAPADEPKLREDLVAAVSYLSSRNLAHCDISLRNVTRVAPGHPFVLIDFDLLVSTDMPQSNYVFRGARHHPSLGDREWLMKSDMQAADLWKVGIIGLWCLSIGHPSVNLCNAIYDLENCGEDAEVKRIMKYVGVPIPALRSGADDYAADGQWTACVAKLKPEKELCHLLAEDLPSRLGEIFHGGGYRVYDPRADKRAHKWWEQCRTDRPGREAWLEHAETRLHLPLKGARAKSFDVYCVKIAFIFMCDRGLLAEFPMGNPFAFGLDTKAVAKLVCDIYCVKELDCGHYEIACWSELREIGLPPLDMLFVGCTLAECNARVRRIYAWIRNPVIAAKFYARLAKGTPIEDMSGGLKKMRNELRSQQALETKAYYLWEAAGKPDGRSLKFWSKATAKCGIS